ncbi:putative heat shock protein 30 protein [Ilyonectria robusta]
MPVIYIRNDVLDVNPPAGDSHLSTGGSDWLWAVTAIYTVCFVRATPSALMSKLTYTELAWLLRPQPQAASWREDLPLPLHHCAAGRCCRLLRHGIGPRFFCCRDVPKQRRCRHVPGLLCQVHQLGCLVSRCHHCAWIAQWCKLGDHFLQCCPCLDLVCVSRLEHREQVKSAEWNC